MAGATSKLGSRGMVLLKSPLGGKVEAPIKRKAPKWLLVGYNHGIIKVGKHLQDDLLQPLPYYQYHPLNHVPKHHVQPFLKNPQSYGDATTSLGNPFQCLTALSEKKCLLISNLNFPMHNLRPRKNKLENMKKQKSLSKLRKLSSALWNSQKRVWLEHACSRK